MKVYYSEDMGRDFDRGNIKRKKRRVGKPQQVNWEFEHMGRRWIIPYIYRFSKGIVFDAIGLLDEREIQAFEEKYGSIEGSELSDLEWELMEQERPYGPLRSWEVWINGERTENGFCSSGEAFLPFGEKTYGISEIERAYRRYRQGNKYFYCERFRAYYPSKAEGHKKLHRLKGREQIKTLKLTTCEQYKLYPVEKRFSLTEGNSEFEMTFTHPLTHIEHQIYFKRGEEIQFPTSEEMSWENLYAVSAQYRVIPSLGKGEDLEFDSTVSYTPPKAEVEEENGEESYLPESHASIGIIGGADGPTAVFIVGPRGEEEDTSEKHCFSKFSQTTEKTEFHLKGLRVLQENRREYEFKYRTK